MEWGGWKGSPSDGCIARTPLGGDDFNLKRTRVTKEQMASWIGHEARALIDEGHSAEYVAEHSRISKSAAKRWGAATAKEQRDLEEFTHRLAAKSRARHHHQLVA